MSITTWNWAQFKGSPECLKWNRRDLLILEEVLQLVPGRRSVVQAGGNLGLFPKRLAQEFAAVYTFEPDPELFRIMLQNAPEPNIVRMQAAVGDKPGRVRMQRGNIKPHGNPHEGTTHVAGEGIIPMMKIDDLCLPDVDLIYLDIEGHEPLALKGAVETIEFSKPVIVLEINANLSRIGSSEAELHSQLIALGYGHSHTIVSDAVFIHRSKL